MLAIWRMCSFSTGWLCKLLCWTLGGEWGATGSTESKLSWPWGLLGYSMLSWSVFKAVALYLAQPSDAALFHVGYPCGYSLLSTTALKEIAVSAYTERCLYSVAIRKDAAGYISSSEVLLGYAGDRAGNNLPNKQTNKQKWKEWEKNHWKYLNECSVHLSPSWLMGQQCMCVFGSWRYLWTAVSWTASK